MKRSQAIERISEIISSWRYEHTLDVPSRDIAEEVLKYLEDSGIQPPSWMKPIPFETNGHQYPLIPGDFQNEQGIWCTPGFHGWEEE